MIRGRSMSDGNLVGIPFLAVNLAASQTAVQLHRVGSAKVPNWTAPGPGWIVGISVDSSAAPTAGTNKFTPTVNGTVLAGVGANDLGVAVPTTDLMVTGSATVKTEQTFNKGDSLGVVVTTNGAFAPSGTDDWYVTLLVGLDTVSAND